MLYRHGDESLGLKYSVGVVGLKEHFEELEDCLLYTSPSPRDATLSRMPSSA